MTPIVVAGENAHDLYHNGHGVHIFVAPEHAYPMIQNCSQSKDMTRDFVCSLTIESTQRALTEQLAAHFLKMVLLLMYLKQQATKAFGQVIFCFLASNCFTNGSQNSTTRIHIFLVSLHYHYWHVWDLIYHCMPSNLCSQRLFRGRPTCKPYSSFQGRHC